MQREQIKAEKDKQQPGVHSASARVCRTGASSTMRGSSTSRASPLCKHELIAADRRTKVNGSFGLCQDGRHKQRLPGAIAREPLDISHRFVQEGQLQDSPAAGAVEFCGHFAGRPLRHQNAHLLSQGDVREEPQLSRLPSQF